MRSARRRRRRPAPRRPPAAGPGPSSRAPARPSDGSPGGGHGRRTGGGSWSRIPRGNAPGRDPEAPRGRRPCRPRRHIGRHGSRCRRCTTTRDRPAPRRCRRPAVGRGSRPTSRRGSRCRRGPRWWPRGRVRWAGRARGAGPEDPEDAVEDLASVSPGAAGASGGGEEVFNEFPLWISKAVPQHSETASLVCMPVHPILAVRSIGRRRWQFSDIA